MNKMNKIAFKITILTIGIRSIWKSYKTNLIIKKVLNQEVKQIKVNWICWSKRIIHNRQKILLIIRNNWFWKIKRSNLKNWIKMSKNKVWMLKKMIWKYKNQLLNYHKLRQMMKQIHLMIINRKNTKILR